MWWCWRRRLSDREVGEDGRSWEVDVEEASEGGEVEEEGEWAEEREEEEGVSEETEEDDDVSEQGEGEGDGANRTVGLGWFRFQEPWADGGGGAGRAGVRVRSCCFLAPGSCWRPCWRPWSSGCRPCGGCWPG